MARTPPSVRWTVDSPLSSAARNVLSEMLGCTFTDENSPRVEMPVCAGVSLVARPDERQTQLVAHFDASVTEPATTQAWLTSWVVRACAAAGLPAPGPMEQVVTGLTPAD